MFYKSEHYYELVGPYYKLGQLLKIGTVQKMKNYLMESLIFWVQDKYDNYDIMSFLESNNLTNLIKKNNCPKGKGSSIDLFNRKYSFKYKSSFQTRFSDHHQMIYTMLKSSFINIKPKLLNYREYKNFFLKFETRSQ